MAALQISRRGVLRSLLAGAAMGVAAAAAPVVDGALKPAFAQSATDELRAAYPAVERDGYTYIKMDHVWRSPLLDVEDMKLSLRRADDPANDPIIITNYSYDGPRSPAPETYNAGLIHAHLFEVATPVLAARSSRPIVLIDVVAAKYTEQNGIVPVHFASLFEALKGNRLGDGDTKADLSSVGGYVAPYAVLEHGGKMLYDFTFNAKEIEGHELTETQKKNNVANNMAGLIDKVNSGVPVAQLSLSDRDIN